MITSPKQFDVTLEKLGHLLDGLEQLCANVGPENAKLFAIQAESVIEDIRRLRQELADYSATVHVAS